MGCGMSFRSSSPPSDTTKIIRVVHQSGHIEDFDYSVTAADVSAKRPKHFVCTKAQLVTPNTKPLRPEAKLEPGQIYFLLPQSLLVSDSWEADRTTLAAKLTAIAKRGPTNDNLPRSNSGSSQRESMGMVSGDSSPNSGGGDGLAALEPRLGSRARTWKPLLDTIRERSFNRRSESDLSRMPSGLVNA